MKNILEAAKELNIIEDNILGVDDVHVNILALYLQNPLIFMAVTGAELNPQQVKYLTQPVIPFSGKNVPSFEDHTGCLFINMDDFMSQLRMVEKNNPDLLKNNPALLGKLRLEAAQEFIQQKFIKGDVREILNVDDDFKAFISEMAEGTENRKRAVLGGIYHGTRNNPFDEVAFALSENGRKEWVSLGRDLTLPQDDDKQFSHLFSSLDGFSNCKIALYAVSSVIRASDPEHVNKKYSGFSEIRRDNERFSNKLISYFKKAGNIIVSFEALRHIPDILTEVDISRAISGYDLNLLMKDPDASFSNAQQLDFSQTFFLKDEQTEIFNHVSQDLAPEDIKNGNELGLFLIHLPKKTQELLPQLDIGINEIDNIHRVLIADLGGQKKIAEALENHYGTDTFFSALLDNARLLMGKQGILMGKQGRVGHAQILSDITMKKAKTPQQKIALLHVFAGSDCPKYLFSTSMDYGRALKVVMDELSNEENIALMAPHLECQQATIQGKTNPNPIIAEWFQKISTLVSHHNLSLTVKGGSRETRKART